MISSARAWVVPVLLFSLAGCGLKGPLYLPDAGPEEVAAPASGASESGKAIYEGRKVRTLPPAPQSQKEPKKDSGLDPSRPPTTSAPPPVSPPDPDRPATSPPPPGP